MPFYKLRVTWFYFYILFSYKVYNYLNLVRYLGEGVFNLHMFPFVFWRSSQQNVKMKNIYLLWTGISTHVSLASNIPKRETFFSFSLKKKCPRNFKLPSIWKIFTKVNVLFCLKESQIKLLRVPFTWTYHSINGGSRTVPLNPYFSFAGSHDKH